MKLDTHPAVFVGVDFFSRRPHNDGGLQPVDLGFGAVVAAPRAPGDFLAQAGEGAVVFRRAAALGFVVVAGPVFGFGDQEFVVAFFTAHCLEAKMARQGEAAPALDMVVVAASIEVFGRRFDFFHAQAHEVLPVILVFVAVGAGVFVDFHSRQQALPIVGRDFGRARLGAFEVEAGGGVLGGGNGADGGKVPDAAVVHSAGALPGDLPSSIYRVGFRAVAAEDEGVAVFAVFVPVVPAFGFPATVQVVVVAFVMAL
jgi:hypothetical protein|nr:hypothetical protein [Azonexus sp.]